MDPKPISPSPQPASDQPLSIPLTQLPLPSATTGGPAPFTQTNDERTRPSALWLLIPLLITALASGGLWAWLQSGAPKKKPEQPIVPATLHLPAQTNPIFVREPPPEPVVPARPPVTPTPVVKPKVRVREGQMIRAMPKLEATASLEGGGDPTRIKVELYSDSGWASDALKVDGEGRVTAEVPRSEGYSVLATAPRYAFALDWVDLKRTPKKKAVLVLEPLRRYQLDVVELDGAQIPSALTVEAGQLWRRIEFSQKQGELYAMGKWCVCIMHPLGKVPEAVLASAVPPDETPSSCDFAMRVGDAFLVRPKPDEGWVVLRLRAPGELASAGPASGRRVVTSKIAQ